jgi:hypothetical protein
VFCFVGGGSEFKRVQRWAEATRHPRVLCLPYQPLAQLSASLSAADAQVVVMGDAMLGLVHPCKIYNLLAVGAPVIYIGPQPSHVTEILDRPESGHPWISVRHGEGEALADHLRQWPGDSASRHFPAALVAMHSKDVLLPRFIAGLEPPDKKADPT